MEVYFSGTIERIILKIPAILSHPPPRNRRYGRRGF